MYDCTELLCVCVCGGGARAVTHFSTFLKGDTFTSRRRRQPAPTTSKPIQTHPPHTLAHFITLDTWMCPSRLSGLKEQRKQKTALTPTESDTLKVKEDTLGMISWDLLSEKRLWVASSN